MEVACPVCERPQADTEHLANHLAITAMLGREDHEAWLDDHAPDWADRSPETLGAEIEDDVETVGTESNGETTQHAHGHDEARPGDLFDDERDGAGQMNGAGRANEARRAERTRGTANGETGQILEEAREMTEQMVRDTDESDESSEDESE